MWRDTVLVAGKDLRIEARSRVVMHQVVPVAVLVLVLFAFALGPDRAPMVQAAPGLFWVAVLFASVLAVQRSFALEAPDGARDGLRLSGLDPGRRVPGQDRGRGGADGHPRGGPDRRCRGALRLAHPFLPVDHRRRPRRHGRPGRGRHPLRRAWRPGCGCARRCCRSSSCRWRPPSCWPGRGRGRPRSGSAPATSERRVIRGFGSCSSSPPSTSLWVSSSSGPSRRRRDHAGADGGAVEPPGHLDRARPRGGGGTVVWPPRSGWACG